jgi:hypothetical protein
MNKQVIGHSNSMAAYGTYGMQEMNGKASTLTSQAGARSSLNAQNL